ncbi:TetR/AcrR family transcriptional regulator C-terminal domain-containing protein [Streptomyces sp. NPDC003077]|uniref:TetR/AcrR family transcriptional regulator C-terminal domain-containing protein n=1 Tax=Streptomyces sp. NPDC003077 TaxID=3154443 RepID=UPI0033B408F5
MGTRLDRKQVVETALRLLNDVGQEGLTLRRIATELNVQAPALYWHFKNKQELLDEMASEMYRRMTGPMLGEDFGAQGWRAQLAETARRLRAELLRYREGAKIFSGTRMSPEVSYEPLERMLGLLVSAGFTPRGAVRAWFTAYSFVVGFVIEEQSVHPMPGERDPAYDLEERERRLADLPLSREAGPTMFDDFDQGFEEGLRIVLAGIEATKGGEG